MRYSALDDSVSVSQCAQAAYFARLSETSAFRQPRGMLASEKLRGAALWTTAAQRDAMTLFELHHNVVSYEAWPLEVMVQASQDEFPYHPSVGLTLSSGRRVALDIVRKEDEGTELRTEFDHALEEALGLAGYGLITLWESNLRHDVCLKNARDVMRAKGPAVDAKAEFGCVRHLADLGTSVMLAELKAKCAELARTACVLAMRRVLSIDLRAPSMNECSVRLPAQGGSV